MIMAAGFGGFAAGLAKGYVDTYSTLSDIERRNKADAREEERMAAWRAEQAQKAESEQLLRQANTPGGKEGTGTGVREALSGLSGRTDQSGANQFTPEMAAGLEEALSKLSPEQAQEALRAYGKAYQGAEGPGLSQGYTYAGPQGLMVTNEAGPQRTPLEAARRYAELAGKAGNSVALKEANQQQATALQIAQGERAESRGKAEDEFSDWLGKSVKQIQQDPVQWVRDHLDEYNKPKPGTPLDDKRTAEVVPGADGKTFSFVQKDAKGNVVSSTPIDATTAQAGLQQIAFARYMALPGKFKEGAELGFKAKEDARGDRKLAIDEDTAKLNREKFAEELKMNPYKIKEIEAKINSYNADASYRSALAKATKEKAGNWTVMGTDSDGQPISYNRNDGAFARPDGKPIQDVSFFKKVTGEKATRAISPEREKAAYTALENARGNKKLVAEIKADYPDVFGEDPLLKALKDKLAGQGKPAEASAPAAPAAAPAAAAKAAPQAALPLTQRLSAAISADNETGNRNNFRAIAAEAEKELPAIQAQVNTLAQALPNVKNPSERANIEARIEALGRDAQMYQSILDQRRAAIGY